MNGLSTTTQQQWGKGENQRTWTIPKWLKNWQYQEPLDARIKVKLKGSVENVFSNHQAPVSFLPLLPPLSISSTFYSLATALSHPGIRLEISSREGHTEDICNRRPRHNWRRGDNIKNRGITKFYMLNTERSPESTPPRTPDAATRLQLSFGRVSLGIWQNGEKR